MSQKLEIELSDRCFEALKHHCQQNSQSPSFLIEQLLSQTLHFVRLSEDSEQNSQENSELDSNQFSQSQQFAELEQRLTRSLTQLIHQTIDARFNSRLDQIQLPQNNSITSPPPKKSPPESEIHQLQIGDLVQIRDPDSNYFSQVLPIVSVGMIRVTVETADGAASFLKRDLRFQRP